MDDRFDDVYEGKFDLETDLDVDIRGIRPGDSRVLDEYLEGTETDDVDIEGLIDVGLSYIEIEQYEQAIETFERVIHIDDENQEAWVNKGFAHAELGEYEAAKSAYREALYIDDSTIDAAKAYLNLAYAEYETGITTEALEDVENALEIDKRLPEAWFNRALFLNELGDHELALNSINNAISLGMRSAFVHEEKARALEGLERYEEAEKQREMAAQERDRELREIMRE